MTKRLNTFASGDQVRALVAFVAPRTKVVTPITVAAIRDLVIGPFWNQVRLALDVTRSYADGLAGAEQMLAWVLEHESEFSEDEFARINLALRHLILQMLDKLDRWEQYLEQFDAHRAAMPMLTVTYSLSAFQTNSFVKKYVVRTDRQHAHVRLLPGSDLRREVIERKLARAARGGRLGNLRHRPQAELSDAEIKRRMAEVIRIAIHQQRVCEWEASIEPFAWSEFAW